MNRQTIALYIALLGATHANAQEPAPDPSSLRDAWPEQTRFSPSLKTLMITRIIALCVRAIK